MFLLVGRAGAAEQVTLTAADGVKVYGTFWPAAAKGAPLILAFHQADGSRAEYTPLAPRLNRAGFSVLAIDQRSGGTEFGGKNRTVDVLGRSTAYDAALADLEAALAWGKTRAQGAPLLVWGSSYSAALVFLLAAAQPGDLQGLLAFSPGEYLGKKGAVRAAAQKVSLPMFITQSSGEDEIEESRTLLTAAPSRDKTLFLPNKRGVHGSSTLRADRNASGAEENWTAVLAFLAKFKAPK
ncbi:MAG: alpha/beta hydrolase [Proteobacteria bacterium]|nr:alpha/beta hydrolase [Burkholderiales bacterium]